MARVIYVILHTSQFGSAWELREHIVISLWFGIVGSMRNMFPTHNCCGKLQLVSCTSRKFEKCSCSQYAPHSGWSWLWTLYISRQRCVLKQTKFAILRLVSNKTVSTVMFRVVDINLSIVLTFWHKFSTCRHVNRPNQRRSGFPVPATYKQFNTMVVVIRRKWFAFARIASWSTSASPSVQPK